MTDFSPEYMTCVERMLTAARAFAKAHPEAEYSFAMPKPGVVMFGNFDETVVPLIGQSVAACALLEAMLTASNQEGTILQVYAILEVLAR